MSEWQFGCIFVGIVVLICFQGMTYFSLDSISSQLDRIIQNTGMTRIHTEAIEQHTDGIHSIQYAEQKRHPQQTEEDDDPYSEA